MTTVSMKSSPSLGATAGSRNRFLSGFLGNIAMAWKMALMVFILFLGVLGITIAAMLGMQRMKYNIDNIYNFMLVPIVAINDAGTGLANIQYELLVLESPNLSAADQDAALAAIQSNDKAFSDVFNRYQTEWITTTSPDFTATLRQMGRLDLQQDEVATVKAMETSYNDYKAAKDDFTKSLSLGQLDYGKVQAANTALTELRALNNHLIAVNNDFAKISDDTALADYNQSLINGGTTLAVALIFGILMSYLIVVSITGRLNELTQSATAIQQGNMDQAVIATGRDEIGLLGTTFNSMAAQLKNLVGTLEQRVAERTKALAAVAEVGTATSAILETDRLLQTVVDFTKERFDLYHSHIYLLDDSGKNLVLASGAGEPGRKMVAEKHSIPLNREQSLVARAARERKGVTVNDVTQAPDFLPNPLLPDTRSELAVPMIVSDKVIGVFDVQSDAVGRFTDTDINIQTTLASQIAISVQNARQVEQTRARAGLETLVNAIGQKIQRAATMEETLQTAIREIGLALGATRVSASIARHNDSGNKASDN